MQPGVALVGLAGIFAGEICERQSFSPTRLVRLSPAGTITASWKLPSCIDGFSTALDASFRRVLLGIGHGYGKCDLTHATDEAATIDGSRIRVISQDPSAHGSNSWPLGW
ncbi:MAG TPA: hypothetical protein VHW74_01605 [Mycobacteriales bacterium]|jgi:hypothetical protein|nr:hypothetical protein [Mycobacteriales bacterium]